MNVFSSELETKILKKLRILYGDQAENTLLKLINLFDKYTEIIKTANLKNKEKLIRSHKFSHKDVILNCYANSIKNSKKTPFESLCTFSANYLKDFINGIHVLPFYFPNLYDPSVIGEEYLVKLHSGPPG